MKILIKDITDDGSQCIMYHMHGNTITKADIVSKTELNEIISQYGELIDSGKYTIETMSYNEYINQ